MQPQSTLHYVNGAITKDGPRSNLPRAKRSVGLPGLPFCLPQVAVHAEFGTKYR